MRVYYIPTRTCIISTIQFVVLLWRKAILKVKTYWFYFGMWDRINYWINKAQIRSRGQYWWDWSLIYYDDRFHDVLEITRKCSQKMIIFDEVFKKRILLNFDKFYSFDDYTNRQSSTKTDLKLMWCASRSF